MVDPNSEDLFGKLPDEILCRVIAFLPPESAFETSFLSKRWRGLWDLASVQQQSLPEGIADEVAGFVAAFDNSDPLRRPRRLRLCSGDGNEVLASLVPNNRLKLDFSFADKQELPSPRPFGCELKMKNLSSDLSSCCSFVKTLHLNSAGSLATTLGDSISSVASRFCFLERLEIVNCDGLKTLRIEGGAKLTSLTILDCPRIESLRLESPKLRSFRYRGKLPRIQPERHFNLSDAMFDFRRGLADGGMVSSDFEPALLTIKNSHVLTLCSWTFETLIWPLKESFIFYKLKELWWIGYSEEQHNTDSLIRLLLLCPALERLFVTIDGQSYRQRNPSRPGSEKAIRNVRHEKLEVVKMEGFLKEENKIRLAKKIREVVSVDLLFLSDCTSADLTPKHAQIRSA